MSHATTDAALLYYCLGCAVMVSCVFGYLSLVRSDFAQHHLLKGNRFGGKTAAEEVRGAVWDCAVCCSHCALRVSSTLA